MKKILFLPIVFFSFFFFSFSVYAENIGWVNSSDGNRYFYDSNGNMYTGIQEIEGKKYLFGATSGKLYYGLTPAPDGYTYYTDSNGVIQTGIQIIENQKYFFDEDNGRLQYGFLKTNDGSLYFSNDLGIIQYGWIDNQNNHYYANEKGNIVVGWKKLQNDTYYFGSDGNMYTWIQEIDGKKYFFGKTSGKLYKINSENTLELMDSNLKYTDGQVAIKVEKGDKYTITEKEEKKDNDKVVVNKTNPLVIPLMILLILVSLEFSYYVIYRYIKLKRIVDDTKKN